MYDLIFGKFSTILYTSHSLQLEFLQNWPFSDASQHGKVSLWKARHFSRSSAEHLRIAQHGIRANKDLIPAIFKPSSTSNFWIYFSRRISTMENKCRLDSFLNGMINPLLMYCLIEWIGISESVEVVPNVYTGVVLSNKFFAIILSISLFHDIKIRPNALCLNKKV